VSDIEVIYEVVQLDADGDAMVHQFGAFTDEAEARKVLDLLEAEGRHGPLALNGVAVYRSATEWERRR